MILLESGNCGNWKEEIGRAGIVGFKQNLTKYNFIL